MGHSILSQIKHAIKHNLDAKASQIIESHGSYLSRRDIKSIITFMDKNKSYSIGVMRYIYYVSPHRHEFKLKRFNGETEHSYTMRRACEAGYSDVVELYLDNLPNQQDVRSKYGDKCDTLSIAEHNYYLEDVARFIAYHTDVRSIEHLLNCIDRKIGIANIWGVLDSVLMNACKRGYTNIVRIVFDRFGGHFKQESLFQKCISAFHKACTKGYNDIVSIFLEYADTNIGADSQFYNSEPIRITSLKGRTEVVRMLLQDQRFDPAGTYNYPILNACASSDAITVKLLLHDERVNPHMPGTMRPIIHVARTVEIMQLLLADGRIDPSARNNYALTNIITKHHSDIDERTKIIKLLLSDKRVIEADLSIAIDEAKPYPHISSLLIDAMARRNVEK